MTRPTAAPPDLDARDLSEPEIIERIVRGERDLFAILMRRYNQQLFRIVRAILGSDAEAEDALQDAYLQAFTRLDDFESRARFSTWMSRIAIRAAIARRERAQRSNILHQALARESTVRASEPEDAIASDDLRRVVEQAIDALPEHERTVVVLRLVEGLSGDETATRLEITEEAVRVRLHRARERLRSALASRLEAELPNAFGFQGDRCDRMVAAVMGRIR
jgi:RNA polymerase sigma-70 factor (ECF subfamily)